MGKNCPAKLCASSIALNSANMLSDTASGSDEACSTTGIKTEIIAQMLVESLTAPTTEHPHERLSDRELQTLLKIASGKRLSDIGATPMGGTPKQLADHLAAEIVKWGRIVKDANIEVK